MAAAFSTLRRAGQDAAGKNALQLGYVALSDAAPLLVAEELGLFARHGLHIALERVPGWASIRDRLAFGALDAAHMLAPMAIAAALGLGGVQADLAVVATLSLNGNTITLGEPLWQEIAAAVPGLAAQRPLTAAALHHVAARRRARGMDPIRLAVVFSFSSHNYLLRDWLAAGGLDPDRDVDLTVVPPALVADALADGRIDGFCAGEPWGSRAVDLRAGRIALAGSQLWPRHPEKVLGVSRTLLEAEPDQATALVAAVMQAGRWLDDPANRHEAACILRDRALDLPVRLIETGLGGRLVFAPGEDPTAIPGPVFHHGHATYPHAEHGAAWFGQMRRWGHVPPTATASSIRGLWTDEPWRRAAGLLGETLPPGPPVWPPAALHSAPATLREDA